MDEMYFYNLLKTITINLNKNDICKLEAKFFDLYRLDLLMSIGVIEIQKREFINNNFDFCNVVFKISNKQFFDYI